MRSRPTVLAAAAAAATLLVAVSARADGDEGLRGPRFGFIPTIGAGATLFTGQAAPFDSFVGESVIQLEFLVDTGRWGGFLRGAYLSSGSGGRWTAPIIAVGGTYRLRGDGEETWGLVARFGAVYQRWHADSAGCDVTLFIPDNCKDFNPPPIEGVIAPAAPIYSTTVDNVGLLGGASFEIPVEPFYVAIGTELSATADVDHSSPGLAISAQLTLSLALRDHVHDSLGAPAAPMRYQTRYQ